MFPPVIPGIPCRLESDATEDPTAAEQSAALALLQALQSWLCSAFLSGAMNTESKAIAEHFAEQKQFGCDVLTIAMQFYGPGSSVAKLSPQPCKTCMNSEILLDFGKSFASAFAVLLDLMAS